MAQRSYVDDVCDVMGVLRRGPVTAAAVAEETGIDHQKVRRVLADLQRRAAAKGVDLQDGAVPSEGGRRATTYRMTWDDLRKLFP